MKCMNKKELINEILNDNSIEYSKEELEHILENELNKPYSERDYDLINEITQYIFFLDDKEVEIDIEGNIIKIINEQSIKKRNYRKFLRIPVAACIIFAILFSANRVSISAFNIDLFSGIIEFGEEIIKFDFNKKEDEKINLKTSIEDPYGIKGELEKLDIKSRVPSYIPEGFELVDLERHSLEDGRYKYLTLLYARDKGHISFDITEYKERIPENLAMPIEDANVERIEIDDIDIFIVTEDELYRSIFAEGLVVYGVSTNLDYDILVQILESFE